MRALLASVLVLMAGPVLADEMLTHPPDYVPPASDALPLPPADGGAYAPSVDPDTGDIVWVPVVPDDDTALVAATSANAAVASQAILDAAAAQAAADAAAAAVAALDPSASAPDGDTDPTNEIELPVLPADADTVAYYLGEDDAGNPIWSALDVPPTLIQESLAGDPGDDAIKFGSGPNGERVIGWSNLGLDDTTAYTGQRFGTNGLAGVMEGDDSVVDYLATRNNNAADSIDGSCRGGFTVDLVGVPPNTPTGFPIPFPLEPGINQSTWSWFEISDVQSGWPAGTATTGTATSRAVYNLRLHQDLLGTDGAGNDASLIWISWNAIVEDAVTGEYRAPLNSENPRTVQITTPLARCTGIQ